MKRKKDWMQGGKDRDDYNCNHDSGRIGKDGENPSKADTVSAGNVLSAQGRPCEGGGIIKGAGQAQGGTEMTLEARREQCQEIFDKFKEDWRTRAELENIEITYDQGDVCFYYKGNLFSEVPIFAFESMFQGVINLRRLMLKELKEFFENL